MSDLIELLMSLPHNEERKPVGSLIFQRGDPISSLYLVKSGLLHLCRNDLEGAAAVVQRAGPGELLAESSVFSPCYHCDAVVVRDALVGRLSIAAVRQAMSSNPEVLAAFARHLAGEVQRTRLRVEILSRRTVRERFDAWLAFNDVRLLSRGSWRSVAEDIGVTPEAFYRELARRRAKANKRS